MRRYLSADYVRGALDSLVTLRLHVERESIAPDPTATESQGVDAERCDGDGDADSESVGDDAHDVQLQQQQQHAPSPSASRSNPVIEANANVIAEVVAVDAERRKGHTPASAPAHSGIEVVVGDEARTRLLVRAFQMACTGSDNARAAWPRARQRSLLFDARLSDSGFHLHLSEHQTSSSPEA